ncbi:hypothetical protein GF340_06255, partial [Candidatus Peregrinibacteria bacterium]|nr:hypothetical protein [Candidatus Peregrinibacteria bacterium]
MNFANESKVTIMDPTPPTFAEIIEPKLDDNPDKIWGALANGEAIKSLASFPDAVEYETVFLLAGTNYQKDGYENFIYSKNGQNGLPLNMDIVEKLEKSNFFYDLGEVGSGSVWAGESMRAMADFFPNANFVLINIGKDTPTEKAEALATVISQKIPQNSLIISLLNYESGSERPIADWQEQFFEEAITNIKCANAENMPIKNETLFKVFQHIMRDLGALEFKENGFI